MTEIFIDKLAVRACHGVNPEEKQNPQLFLISARLFVDAYDAAKNDDLTKTLHYGHISKALSAFVVNNCFDLIETLAEKAARIALTFSEDGEYFPVREVVLTVEKPEAPIAFDFATLGVTVRRSWRTVGLSLGSNLGDRNQNLKRAVELLSADARLRDVRVSNIIETPPFECAAAQNDYLNCAVVAQTVCEPMELLELTESIERLLGRTGKRERAPRTADIDITFLGDCVLDTERLIIPHADMHRRYFVLKPLSELAPHWVHPLYRTTVIEMLESLPK